MGKPGRNDPCPCGNGLKYKRCCVGNDAAAERARLAANKVRLEKQAAEYGAQLEGFANRIVRSARPVNDKLSVTPMNGPGLMHSG